MTYYYPNRMGRILVASMRNVLGRDQFNTVIQVSGLPQFGTSSFLPNNLEKRFAFEVIAGLQAGVEQVLGQDEGRRLNWRIGQGTFALGLKDFDPVVGVADLPRRVVPLGVKFRVGLDVFARVFNQFSDQVVKISDSEGHYLWVIERCPVCWGRQTETPCCHLAGGLLAEATAWASGGRRFEIVETRCKANGDANCTFQISKTPIDDA